MDKIMIHRIMMLLISGLAFSLFGVHYINNNPSGGFLILAIFSLIAVFIDYIEGFDK